MSAENDIVVRARKDAARYHPHATALLREAAAEIVRLRGEVCSCPSGDGSLRWPCKAHPPGAIAPAEAKGDGWEENVRYLLDSYPGSIRVCPGAGHEELIGSLSVTFIKLRDLAMKAPQPADGGASHG